MQTESLEVLVHRLASRKGEWRAISRQSSVPYDTLTKIAQGKTKNPRLNTVRALLAALTSGDHSPQ